MDHTVLEKIEILSPFWDRHRYCLAAETVEKGIRLLATAHPEFRSEHSPFFLTKLINTFCAFESKIASLQGSAPQQGALYFRLFKEKEKGSSTLGIAVTLQVSGNTEFLSQERLLQAVLHIVPGVQSLPSRGYQYRDEQNGLLFLYQEIEKKRGRGFTQSDVQQLNKLLPKELEESVEYYSPSLFLIRNEEEIFRNIVQMSRELNTPEDSPQVTISFQEQTRKGRLRFSVVIVRLVTSLSPSLTELGHHLPQTIALTLEMSSEIGSLQTSQIKQGNILTFEVDSALFARKNCAIDLREARQYIFKALELMIGPFRDFNGGLFSKQHKQLKAIQEIVESTEKSFLESLFYSFTPSLFQTFILPEAGKACATLFLEAKNASLSPSKPYEILKHHEPAFSLIVIKTGDEHLKNNLVREITNFSFPLHQFGYTHQFIKGEHYMGLVYQYPTNNAWLDSIDRVLKGSFVPAKQAKKFLRINFLDGDPLSLNPQIGLDLRCRSLQKALFEGLMRIAPSGIPEPAGASKIDISEDGKTYCFSLRALQWSNGEPLTAHDFERSWKRAIRSPSCLRPDLYYIIKNARRAHFNQVNIDEIGVKALNAYTLEVTLEYPAPYFLQMLTHPLFFPVYENSGEPYVFSGPFTLHSWQRNQSMALIKNPYYWDFEHIKLEGVEISIIRDPHLAFQKYEAGELDWIGGPFSPLHPSIASGMENKMQRVDTPGVSWLYCNLTHPPFSSQKVRQALSMALNREALCEKTLLHFTPLLTHLPKELSRLTASEIQPTPDITRALALFKEGLEATHCSLKKLSELTLLHSHIPGQKELAQEIQRQWQEVFGIRIRCLEESWNTFSHQLDNRLFHFGSCYRHPFYNDPMYFFQIFYEPTNIHNAFGWHSERFNHWINQAQEHPEEKTYLKEAEKELLEQMPVIPLHQVSYLYLARPEVCGIHFCHSGDVDFKWIYFNEE